MLDRCHIHPSEARCSGFHSGSRHRKHYFEISILMNSRPTFSAFAAIFLLVAAIRAIMFALCSSARKESESEISILSISTVIWTCHALHFFLFPRRWEDFFAVSYLIIFYLFVYAVTQALENKRQIRSTTTIMNERSKSEPLSTTP